MDGLLSHSSDATTQVWKPFARLPHPSLMAPAPEFRSYGLSCQRTPNLALVDTLVGNWLAQFRAFDGANCEAPIVVEPAQGGGYTGGRGGARLVVVNQTPDGGFGVQLIGRSSIWLRPRWGGGFTIDQPNVSSSAVEPVNESQVEDQAPYRCRFS